MGGDYHRPYKFDFSFFRVKIAKKHSHYLREFAVRQPVPRFGVPGGTKRTGGDGTPPLQYLISADTGSKK